MDIASLHGHSMVSMAFYGFIFYYVYKYIKNKTAKIILCLVLGITICVIGCSRIYLGVHYASDVIGGFCLSLIYLTIYTKFARGYIENKEK